MTTLFSRILAGELPAHFVWDDSDIAAFLSIAPLRAGHTLVVPRQEVDQWTDMAPDLLAKCTWVAQTIGHGVKRAWDAPRAGLLIAGLEVPHMHIHVSPVWDMSDFNFLAIKEADDAALGQAAKRLRTALRELGHSEHVPDDD
jgi:diadenosine tetraphosphate (Ap4A) HIT family hydrolase